MATVERETKETRVVATVSPGKGDAKVQLEGALAGTEPGQAAGALSAFARHMVESLAKWSGYDVTVDARSKDGLEHHLVEDVALTLGRAFRRTLDVGAIERVGHAYVPMDEALVLAALDLVERPYYSGKLPDTMMDHFMRSFATEGGMTLHLVVLRGDNPHHIVEAAVKATAIALRQATRPRADRLSTKGAVDVREAR